MAPKKKSGTRQRITLRHHGSRPSRDRARHLEDAIHHPYVHPEVHPPHKPQKKPVLPPRHSPHSHPHGEDLAPHTNRPGPIKPAKKMTLKGSRTKK